MGKKGVVKPKKASSFVRATDASKLVEQAQLALEKAEPELALKFFERAHSINNLDTSIMDSMADVLLQLDEPERAFSLLTRSIELEPQANPCKYLYLAQLQTNHEALASYRTGINFLSSERDGADPEKLSLVNHHLSKAFNGIAELYLTDLCFEENAEQECEAAVNESLSLDPSIDTKHLFASLRISQNRMSEACDVLEEIYQRIKHNREMLAQRTVIDELAGLPTANPQDEEIYSEELCTTTAKMLIECSTLRPVLSRYAIDILTALLEHNDENIQLWYLAGVAELGPENHPESADLDAAQYYLTQAKEMVEEIRKQNKTGMPMLEEELSLISHHLLIVEQQMAASQSREGPEQDEEDKGREGDEEEEWSDEEEGGMEMAEGR